MVYRVENGTEDKEGMSRFLALKIQGMSFGFLPAGDIAGRKL